MPPELEPEFFGFTDSDMDLPVVSETFQYDGPLTLGTLLERLRNTPTHLCRLRYFGDEERWGFAFYTYSNERYELSVFPSGEFLGPPEEAFDASAGLYLGGRG